MLLVHEKTISHVNTVNSNRIKTGIPRPVNMLELWTGKRGNLDSIEMSNQRKTFFQQPPFQITVYRDQPSPGLFSRKMVSSSGKPVYAFKLDRFNAAFFALYSPDKSNFYLLNAMDALLYPRGFAENQQVLGRILRIKLHPEQEAVELLFDAEERGTEVSDLSPDMTGEFFHPFFAHESLLKPISYWDQRLSDDRGRTTLDNGENAKVRAALQALYDMQTSIPENPIIFDPSCGTGFPMSAVLCEYILNKPNAFTSDLSPAISHFAHRRILDDLTNQSKTDVSLQPGYGDAITGKFTGLGHDNNIAPWISNNSVNVMLLRFLNQGVIPSYAHALASFRILSELLASGGIMLMFGYSSTFLNSFDFDPNIFNICQTSFREEEGLMFTSQNGRMSLVFDKLQKPWTFPFYVIQKREETK